MPQPPFPYETSSAFADILSHASRLARSPDSAGTLVIQVVGAEPFVQFGGGADGIEMEFPLITPEQRSRESALRRFLDEPGLKMRVTFGDNGAQFLDVDLPGEPNYVAQLARDVLTSVMGVEQSGALSFMGEGLGVAV